MHWALDTVMCGHEMTKTYQNQWQVDGVGACWGHESCGPTEENNIEEAAEACLDRSFEGAFHTQEQSRSTHRFTKVKWSRIVKCSPSVAGKLTNPTRTIPNILFTRDTPRARHKIHQDTPFPMKLSLPHWALGHTQPPSSASPGSHRPRHSSH